MVELWNLNATLVHIGLQKLQIMPKLYLGPGLSRRVHQALSRRLEQFMAANAEVPAPREELPLTENPPLPANAGAADTESEKGEEHGNHPPEEVNKSPAEREDRDDDRSRSPRLRVPEPDPNSTADLLASTTTMAIGVTSMVGALKSSSEKLEILIQQSQNLQKDLCRSLETVSSAVNNMARGIETLAAGVNYNTGRVGAVCGEYTKLKKHLEWAMDVSMGEVLKKNAKNRTERDQALKEVMDQLFESMDKLQENLQKIAVRIENAPVGHEGTTGYDPPQPPTGHLGSPSVTPLTPAPGMILGAGIPPPPAVPPAPMVPPKPMVPPQPPLPVVKFVGYIPAKMGELPMSHPLQLEVKDIKNPPCQVVEEATGRIRCVSPTARHDPATGTAAFAPLGYVQGKGTSEYRRVYP